MFQPAPAPLVFAHGDQRRFLGVALLGGVLAPGREAAPLGHARQIRHASGNAGQHLHAGSQLGHESGCGKSTTGRIINHLLVPDSGEVWFQGKEISKISQDEMRPLRKDVALQDDPLLLQRGIGDGHGGEQGLRIGVNRIGVQLGLGSGLHHKTQQPAQGLPLRRPVQEVR